MRRLKLALPILLFLCMVGVASLNAADSGSYVGTDTCKGCHDAAYETYANSVHAKKAIPGSPAAGAGCEACHGAGAGHVEKGGGKGTGVIGFDRKEDAKKKSAQCLSCHEGMKHLAFWSMSKHKSAGVSCDSCHSGHAGGEKGLKEKQPELCNGCHRDIKMQANKQSHHPIREGKIVCSDCHDPHGSFGPKMVKADTINELCYKCHAEKRGPYMWEHLPVEENCLNCHYAHGSNHNSLLVKKAPLLCQSCHDWSRHPGTPYTKFDTFERPGGGNPLSNKLVARSCLNCHTNIHGSNGPVTHGETFVR